MKSDSRKNRVATIADRSLLVNAFRKAALWLYRSIGGGFFGTILTSYNKEEELFTRSLSGFGTRRVRGRETFYKKVRRRVAGSFENSLLLAGLGAGSDYMLGCSLRVYGAFSIIFGIYAMLIYTIQVYALRMQVDFGRFMAGAIIVVLSVPMLASKKTLAECIQGSRIARYLLIDALKIPEAKFTQKLRSGNAKYNAAVILGMVFGFMTYFVSPVAILMAFALIVVCWVIFHQPEAGILGLIIITPLLSVTKHPTFLLALGVLITTLSYLIKYLRGKRTMRFGLLGCFVTLFAINQILGGMVSVGGAGSFASAAMYAILLLGYFLIVNLIRTRENCRHAMAALAITLVVVSFSGMAQYILGRVGSASSWLDSEMFSYIPGRVTAFFDNPNMLGSYIILVFPLLIALALYARGINKRFLVFLSVISSLFCLVWTWSRGAWLGFLIGITLFFLIFSYKTLAVLLGIGLTTPLLGYVLPEGIVGRFMSIGNLADSSTYYRVMTWRGVLEMLRETWVGGIGVGQAAFEQLYPAFAYAGTELVPHAHNLAMQVLVETGISGLVILIITILLFIQNCFEFILRSVSPAEDKMTVSAGLCGIISILVMGLFDHVWYNFRVFFLFWVMMALTVSYMTASRNENEAVYDKLSPDSADISLYIG
ncbi:MAG TPA: O-antigen ligase family protein [Bacillota bacterium]|nr:O-antigen ligase family protein [Bacillota bacterium]